MLNLSDGTIITSITRSQHLFMGVKFLSTSLQTYITPTRGWETDIAQMHACGGDVGGKAVHSSQNHNARCGKLNIFYEDNNGCIIATIPTVLPPPMPTGIKQIYL